MVFRWLGRHPCLGMKIAMLELKMVVALFVVGYGYDVVDAKGKLFSQPPLVDYNAQLQVRFKLVLFVIQLIKINLLGEADGIVFHQV